MHFIPNEVYHIYNRGNNRRSIFFKPENYSFFLQKVTREWAPIVDILCWCLMPNHFHFMVYTNENSCNEKAAFGGKPMQELSYKIGKLLSSYSQAINKQNHTTGSLFQQKTKAKNISAIMKAAQNDFMSSKKSSPYIINCMHYIHQNPWRAGLAARLDDWPYSSFLEITESRGSPLINADLLCELTGYDRTNFEADSYAVLDEEKIRNIW